jgi:hypothetical protein
MRCSRSKQLILLIAGVLMAPFLAILAVPLVAQAANQAPAQHPWNQAYDKAREITVDATIQEVVSHRVAKSPVGLHLVVTSSQGVFDAHLGPYMSKTNIEALHAGAQLQIVGAVQQINGRPYLLARQVVLDGRTVTVRTERGFFVREMAARSAAPEKRAEADSTGGAR